MIRFSECMAECWLEGLGVDVSTEVQVVNMDILIALMDVADDDGGCWRAVWKHY